MSAERDALARLIWNVAAEEKGTYTIGVTSEAAHNIADSMLPLLAKAWNEGSRAGWSDRTRSLFEGRTYQQEVDLATPNPYGEEVDPNDD